MAINDPRNTETVDDFLGINKKREEVQEPVSAESLEPTVVPPQEDVPVEGPPEAVTQEAEPSVLQEQPEPPTQQSAQQVKEPTDLKPQQAEDLQQQVQDPEEFDSKPLLDFTRVANAKANPEAHTFMEEDRNQREFFGDTIWKDIKETAYGILKAPSKVAINFTEAAAWVGEQGYKISGIAPLVNYLAPEVGASMDEAFETNHKAFQSLTQKVDEIVPTTTGLGDTTSAIAQFGLSMFAVGGPLANGVKTITKTPMMLEGTTKVGLASMLGFDQHTENLGNVMNEFPELRGPLTEYLAKKDDDGFLLGRAKNVVDGIVMGIVGKAGSAAVKAVAPTVTEGFMKGVEALKHMSPWGWTDKGAAKTVVNFAEDISEDLPVAARRSFIDTIKRGQEIFKGSGDAVVMQMQSFLTTASHIPNIIGSASMFGVRLEERAMSRLFTKVDDVVGGHLLGGKPGVAPGEVSAMMQGAMYGVALSFKDAIKHIKTKGVGGTLAEIGAPMKPLPARGSRLDYPQGLGAHTFKSDPNSKLGRLADLWGNWIVNPNFKALGAEDSFARRYHYFAEYNSLITRKAYNKGFRGEALEKEIQKMYKKGSSSLALEATKTSKRNVYMADPEWFGKAVEGFRNSTGFAGKGTIPFLNTLNNINKEKLHRFPPTSLLFREAWSDLRAGGVRRADRMAKISTGLMATGLFWSLPDDIFSDDVSRKDSGVVSATGAGEYTMRIMGQNIAYKDSDMLGGLIRMIRDSKTIVGQLQELRDDGNDKDIQDVMYGTGLLLGAAMTDSTWGESLIETIAAFTGDPNDPQDQAQFKHFLQGKALSALVPNVVRRVSTSLDQHVRELQTFKDKLIASIPGLSDKYPIKYDVYGRERTPARQGVSGMLSPVGMRPETDDPFDNFLMDSEIRIQPPKYETSFTNEFEETAKLDLREHPHLYSEMNRLIGELPHDDYDGKTLSQYLHYITVEDNDEAKEFRDLSNGPKGKKQKVISGIMEDYRKQARQYMVENIPEVKVLMDNYRRETELEQLALENSNLLDR